MENQASQGSQGLTPSTTFVQADVKDVQELVQCLTRARGDQQTRTVGAATDAANEGVPLKVTGGARRPTSRLHERWQHTRPKLQMVINKPGSQSNSGTFFLQPAGFGFPSPTEQAFSPSNKSANSSSASPLSTPTKILSSNISILNDKKEGTTLVKVNNKDVEQKAIKEKHFYLISPRSKPGNSEPELLTLFPLTSPKTAHESS
ncbi:PREDICTED: VQ motif-containing protein 31-like [Nelumbo nucifera]|uniref:Uncharacterized protein n=2 Tax=Nelumbo nucifera TaxID=4432 RepID=A0A822Z270_NELNU|nr:PREDICTED: VQ motif-containing protein 31-like [Nelumbo nucifera]DAD38887.1 TPA_asm: hypothetical protein HUJ06_013209 [Nelumbo nucifera]